MSVSVTCLNCHVCGASSLEPVEEFGALCRVTSDCKPWPRGGRLSVCRECGCMQKALDAEWLEEISRIYGSYTVYYQSDGVEQAVFESGSGQAALRSDRLLGAFGSHIRLPETGRMLDLGCGNGAMLRAFGQFAPGWTMAGAELSDKSRETVESIKGVEAFYVGGPDEIPGSFNVITMIHMLEHIPRPVEYLLRLQDKLKPDGLLIIEVPNCLQNPFDLLVADHASHFTARTAAELIERSGYQVLWAATDWVPKELSIVARKATRVEEQRKTSARLTDDPLDATRKRVEWLKETAKQARSYAAEGGFGIFGTSIAATWLSAEVGDGVQFFVDEDPARIGKTFMGRRVYHPLEVPAGSNVFIALPPPMAESVRDRAAKMAKKDVRYYLPPPSSF